MLINARQAEETRIAIVKDNQLIDLDIESVDREQKKSNIYKAKISRIEPSLNAVFVNYGEDKNGFLPYKEISPEYFKNVEKDQNTPLNELLDVGQELIVQIAKEERGSKGAALTTYITLAGCYMVLMPNNPSAGGISRRIEGDERRKLKALFDSLTIPKEMGVIIRTAGVDRSAEEIQADLDTLVNLWEAIKRISYQRKAPFLIHKESDITIRAIRDHLKEDIEEIVIDAEEAHDDLKRQLAMLRPHFTERLSLYAKDLPLFNAHQIEKQIESAFKREVHLPSGGSIVIDTTEALTAIDINSARATKGDNIEETALATNLEAAVEIARQLRLRDLGGLVVVDFIDMSFFPNQKAVEQQLTEALIQDRAKIQMTRISKFGLVEISRQRLQASLGESVMHACPRCQGHGFIRSVPSLALSIIRNIRAEALREKTNEIRVQLPVDIATFLLNEKRDEIYNIEQSTNVKVLLIPNANLQSPHFNIQRIWGDVYNANRTSFDLIEKEKDVAIYKAPKADKSKQPALKSAQQHNNNNANRNTQRTDNAKPNTGNKNASQNNRTQKPVSKKQEPVKKGFWAKVQSFFFSESEKETITSHQRKPEQHKSGQANRNQQQKQKRPNQSNQQNRSRTQDRPDRQERPDTKKENVSNNRTRDNNKNQNRDNNNRNQRRDNNYNANGSDSSRNDSRNNRNNRSRQQHSGSRLQVHQSEELIDINNLKQSSPEAVKAAKEKALMKTISTTPEEKISVMVKEVLSQAPSLASDNAVQVETATSGKKVKYLNFEVVTLDKEKSLEAKNNTPKASSRSDKKADGVINPTEAVEVVVEETQIELNVEIESPEQNKAEEKIQAEAKKPRQKRPRKGSHVTYSPAVDTSSQGYVSVQVTKEAPKKSQKSESTSA